MAWIEIETVSVVPLWIVWIEFQKVRVQYVYEIRTTHGTTWVT